MATDVCKLEREANWAFKVETSTGVPISIGASDGTVNVWDPTLEPDIAFLRREGQGTSIDPIVGGLGTRGANIGFTTELYGSATVPGYGDALLAAGALLTSRTYSFATPTINTTTLTVGAYQSGWLLSASGVKLNWVLTGKTGEKCMNRFEGTGLWQPPTATAQIAPTYNTTVAPRFAAATFTIGAVAEIISDFELNLNNNIVYREDPADVTGYHAACITDRNITFTCAPERKALGTRDWYAAYLAGTEYALNLVIGTAANNIITITAPKMQLAAPPKKGSRNGILVDNLTFQLNRSAAAGDDALVVAYT
jgi:hypothetical protein